MNLSATSCIIYSSSDFTRIHFIYLCDKNFYGTRYPVSYKRRAVWLSELVPLERLSSQYVCHMHTSSVSVSPVSVVTLLEITDQLFITTTTPFSLHFVTHINQAKCGRSIINYKFTFHQIFSVIKLCH